VGGAGEAQAPFVSAWALVAALSLAAPGEPTERWDHRGSLGVDLALGADLRAAVTQDVRTDNGARGDVQLGGVWGVTDRLELHAAARGSFFGPALGLGFLAGLRSMYGQRFKTFFDLDVFVVARPIFVIGPHVAFGGIYELSQVVSLYACLGAQMGYGDGLRIGGEALVGLQLRSFVFE
jgi:hypothetical protein